jgi:hypothetical protein
LEETNLWNVFEKEVLGGSMDRRFLININDFWLNWEVISLERNGKEVVSRTFLIIVCYSR